MKIGNRTFVFDGFIDGAACHKDCVGGFDVGAVNHTGFNATHGLRWRDDAIAFGICLDDVFDELLVFKKKKQIDVWDAAKAFRMLFCKAPKATGGDEVRRIAIGGLLV